MATVRRGVVTHTEMHYPEVIPEAARWDLDFVEILMEGTHAREHLADEVNEVRTLADVHGVDIAVHLPLRVDLASPYEHVRDGSLVEIETALEVAGRLEARKAVVHASTMAFRGAYDDDDLLDNLIASLQHLDARADDHGVDLCVENLKDDFCTLRDDFARIFEETDASVCLDTGHAYVQGLDEREQAALLAERGDRISHVHINDTRRSDDDEHLPMEAGFLDFETLLDPIRRDWSGSVSLEVFTDDFGYLEESVERLDALL